MEAPGPGRHDGLPVGALPAVAAHLGHQLPGQVGLGGRPAAQRRPARRRRHRRPPPPPAAPASSPASLARRRSSTSAGAHPGGDPRLLLEVAGELPGDPGRLQVHPLQAGADPAERLPEVGAVHLDLHLRQVAQQGPGRLAVAAVGQEGAAPARAHQQVPVAAGVADQVAQVGRRGSPAGGSPAGRRARRCGRTMACGSSRDAHGGESGLYGSGPHHLQARPSHGLQEHHAQAGAGALLVLPHERAAPRRRPGPAPPPAGPAARGPAAAAPPRRSRPAGRRPGRPPPCPPPPPPRGSGRRPPRRRGRWCARS